MSAIQIKRKEFLSLDTATAYVTEQVRAAGHHIKPSDARKFARRLLPKSHPDFKQVGRTFIHK